MIRRADPAGRAGRRHRRHVGHRPAVGAGPALARAPAAADRRPTCPSAALPYLRAREVELDYARVLLARVTYVGELGLRAARADRVRPRAVRRAARRRRRPRAAPGRPRRDGRPAAGEGVPRLRRRHRQHRQPARGRASASPSPGTSPAASSAATRCWRCGTTPSAAPARWCSCSSRTRRSRLHGNEPVLLDGSWVGYVRAAGYGAHARRRGRPGRRRERRRRHRGVARRHQAHGGLRRDSRPGDGVAAADVRPRAHPHPVLTFPGRPRPALSSLRATRRPEDPMAKNSNAENWTDVLAAVPLFAEVPRRSRRAAGEGGADPAPARVHPDRPRGRARGLLLPPARGPRLGEGDPPARRPDRPRRLLRRAVRCWTACPGRRPWRRRRTCCWPGSAARTSSSSSQSEPKVAVALLKTMAGRLRGAERATTQH